MYALSEGLRVRLRGVEIREEVVDEIGKILKEVGRDEIKWVIGEEDVNKEYSVNVDISEVAERSQRIVNEMSVGGEEYLAVYDLAAGIAQVEIIREEEERGIKCRYKPRCTVRMYVEESMISGEDGQIRRIPGSKEVGMWRILRSTVVRTSEVKVAECEREVECEKCGGRWLEGTRREEYDRIEVGKECRVGGKKCRGGKIKKVGGEGVRMDMCKDYQEIRVQERRETGKIPRCINVILERDLVGLCQAGEEVLISGIVIRRYKFRSVISGVEDRCEVEVAIVANHIKVIRDYQGEVEITESMIRKYEIYWEERRAEGKEIGGRDEIIKVFCERMYGMYIIKLAIIMVLVGGVENRQSDMKIRGDAHILLIGEPGTGKSQLLRYTSKIGTRCILTNSVGTTSAGLTCSAVKEGNEWHLEAGALVLADRGICLIDEFGALKASDRVVIHEAMEQQTISVAKAGIVSKLNSRCSIIAACNPKLKFDPVLPMEVNVGLSGPLLSRFDLIFYIPDIVDCEHDSLLAEFILSDSKTFSRPDTSSLSWSVPSLQAYIAHVKSLTPILDSAPRSIISSYYQFQRSSPSRDPSRTTIRLLESLIRLSQAHAKFLMHSSVSTLDAITAIILIDLSLPSSILAQSSFSSALSTKSSFIHDPDDFFSQVSLFILTKLNLTSLL